MGFFAIAAIAAGIFLSVYLLLQWLDEYLYIFDRPASQIGRYLYTTIERTNDEIPGRLRNSEQSKSDDSRDGEISCYS